MPSIGRPHEVVQRYKTEYGLMLTDLGIPLDHIDFYGDVKEIWQGHTLAFYRNGVEVTWVGGPLHRRILNVHLNVSSLSHPETEPYEMKMELTRIDDGLYHTQPLKIKHSCKESDFLEEYRQRGWAKSPCHHKIAARIATERSLPGWCPRWKVEPMQLEQIYPDISANNYREMSAIIEEAEKKKTKSVPLRRELYQYAITNHIKLYGAEVDVL